MKNLFLSFVAFAAGSLVSFAGGPDDKTPKLFITGHQSVLTLIFNESVEISENFETILLNPEDECRQYAYNKAKADLEEFGGDFNTFLGDWKFYFDLCNSAGGPPKHCSFRCYHS